MKERMKKYKKLIIAIALLFIAVIIILHIHKRWSCKPIDTDVTKIETIFIITHGKEIELSQKGIEELLSILDKVKYKQMSMGTAEAGTPFSLVIVYKDGQKMDMSYYGWYSTDSDDNYYKLMHSKELMDFAERFNE